MKHIATHNGTFHADEVTAIALIKYFIDDVEVERLPHQTPEKDLAYKYDFVIDMGRKFDNSTRFDHHQFEANEQVPNVIGNRSSAGLIWQYIKDSQPDLNIPDLDALIRAVDDNDVGIKPAALFEYSRLIGNYNLSDIHCEGQYHQFLRAVDVAVDAIANICDYQAEIDRTISDIESAKQFENFPEILEFPRYLPGWNRFLHGKSRPEIEAVVWYDDKLHTYNVQTTNTEPGSYDKVGKQLYPCGTMDFVHANKFFAVAKDRETLITYLNQNFKD